MKKSSFFTLLILFFLHFNTAQGQPAPHIFHVLYDSKDALQCRIDLIQQAKKEILVSYFILTDDLSGTLFLHLLAEASSKRGVIVQVIIDKNGSKISAPMQAYLKKNGVIIRRFFLKNKGLKKFYHGMHEKVLLVDRRCMIVGGRNIKDAYYGLSPDFNFFDYDVLVTGDSMLQDARVHFYTLWHDDRLTADYPAPEVTTEKVSQNLENIQTTIAEVQSKLSLHLDTQTDWVADSRKTTSPVGFINDDFYVKKGQHYVGSDVKDFGSTNALIHFIDSAKYSIYIENPYFVPTKAWKTALSNALKRGVKVRLLTNSLQSTDLPIRQASYRNLRKKWVHRGLEIWEYQGPLKWHAKALLIDAEIVVIGSYNLHRPSEKFNTEVAVWIKNKNIAQTQANVMANNLENALQIGTNNKTIARPDKHFKRASLRLKTKFFIQRNTVARVFGWLM
jgi:cardiolipin synthase C